MEEQREFLTSLIAERLRAAGFTVVDLRGLTREEKIERWRQAMSQPSQQPIKIAITDPGDPIRHALGSADKFISVHENGLVIEEPPTAASNN